MVLFFLKQEMKALADFLKEDPTGDTPEANEWMVAQPVQPQETDKSTSRRASTTEPAAVSKQAVTSPKPQNQGRHGDSTSVSTTPCAPQKRRVSEFIDDGDDDLFIVDTRPPKPQLPPTPQLPSKPQLPPTRDAQSVRTTIQAFAFSPPKPSSQSSAPDIIMLPSVNSRITTAVPQMAQTPRTCSVCGAVVSLASHAAHERACAELLATDLVGDDSVPDCMLEDDGDWD